MRSFLLGLFVLVALSMTVLSLRPGGIRRQLRFAARRLKIAIVLGGIYVLVSGVIRFAAPEGALADFGPPVLALLLGLTFVVVAQEPDGERSAANRP